MRNNEPLPLSLALRRYLYATAAVTGGAIMIVEILGARMLAPWFGTSHFVWTAQIAVTLVALAAGYYAGGKLVDHRPHPGRLYLAILAAALYLCFTVLAVEPAANFFLRFNLALGSLLASTFLFLVPLGLLAMTGPFFVRVITADVNGVGGNVGRLTAVSTLGSFAGTLLIGYVLIPLLPNSTTMILTAGALLAIVAGYFLAWQPARSVAISLVGVAAMVATPLAATNAARELIDEEHYRANSHFGLLQVIDQPANEARYFLTDFLMQNIYDPMRQQSRHAFSYMLETLAAAYTDRLDNILCIGLGVGIVPRNLARQGARVDAVEINPAVVEVAQRFFDFDPALVRMHIADGRQHLNRSTNRYDCVILDAFLGDSAPAHLMSREAFAAIRRVLNPGGVLVIHSWGNLNPGRDFTSASLDKTLRAEFPSVVIHHDASEPGTHSLYFVAGTDAVLSLRGEPAFDHVHPACRRFVEASFAGRATTAPGSGIVLTDDFNPVDFHDAVNREEIRRIVLRDVGNL